MRAIGALRDDGIARAMSDAAHDHYWRDPPTLDAHAARISAIYREVTGAGQSSPVRLAS